MATAVGSAGSTDSFLARHHFLLRRLHSLTGIVPIGAFLINHLLTNSTIFLGAKHFDEHVMWIHALPWLIAVEITFIFLPLAFHALYGVVIAMQGRPNSTAYPYMDNWRYTLQRVTAWITLVFIVLHLAHYRFAHWFGFPNYKDANPAFYDHTVAGFYTIWLPLWAWMVIYAIGTTAAVFHFCNGIVTFCISWGITVGDVARKRVSVGALLLGLLLCGWGGAALYRIALAKQGEPTGPAPAAIVAPGH